jgi:hypothetical protein
MKKTVKMPGTTAYDAIPQGWSRVRAAVSDRAPWSQVGPISQDWERSRFSDSEALKFVVEEGVLEHRHVEAWMLETGKVRP